MKRQLKMVGKWDMKFTRSSLWRSRNFLSSLKLCARDLRMLKDNNYLVHCRKSNFTLTDFSQWPNITRTDNVVGLLQWNRSSDGLHMQFVLKVYASFKDGLFADRFFNWVHVLNELPLRFPARTIGDCNSDAGTQIQCRADETFPRWPTFQHSANY